MPAAAVKVAKGRGGVVNITPLRQRARLTNQQRNIRSRASAQKRTLQARANYEAEVTAQEVSRARQRATISAQRQQQSLGAQRAFQRQTRVENVAADTAGAIAKPGAGIGSTIALILFTMAGLILVYILVTKSQQFAGFTGSLGTALSKLTTTEPLFQKVTTK